MGNDICRKLEVARKFNKAILPYKTYKRITKPLIKDMQHSIAEKRRDSIIGTGTYFKESVEKPLVLSCTRILWLSCLFNLILPKQKYDLIIAASISDLHEELFQLRNKCKNYKNDEELIICEYADYIIRNGLQVFMTLPLTVLVDLFARRRGPKF